MENSALYLLLNLAAIAVPLLLSFDRKVQFYRRWPYLFPAILIVGTPFVLWDIHFANSGYWGFNERYLTGMELFGLPLAEVLFFFTVPYACIFIYETLGAYWGDRIRHMPLEYALWILIAGAAVLFFAFPGRIYTMTATLPAAAVAAGLLIFRPVYTRQLTAAFLVSVIPFLLMNGILTGTGLPEPVVWYSGEVFSGLRIGTIPFEDNFYSFSLIALNIIVMEALRAR